MQSSAVTHELQKFVFVVVEYNLYIYFCSRQLSCQGIGADVMNYITQIEDLGPRSSESITLILGVHMVLCTK